MSYFSLSLLCVGAAQYFSFVNAFTRKFRTFIWWRYCLAVCDEIFDHFPLSDETLRPIELCNAVISQKYSEICQNFLNSVGKVLTI